jgi:hypothetical protein
MYLLSIHVYIITLDLLFVLKKKKNHPLLSFNSKKKKDIQIFTETEKC